MKSKRKGPPKGFDVIAYRLEVLENEMRDKIKESNAGKRNTESVWPVHQINYQRSRYVYDMYVKYHQISKKVYDYCIKHKLIDANLIAKWKKTGYEKLCSTYVINPANYKFGTTSICRVPLKDRNDSQLNAQDPTTGCYGCFSGAESLDNIFKNQYGQDLARIQVEREMKKQKQEEQRKQDEILQREAEEIQGNHTNNESDDDGESETDDESSDDDDNYGPTPEAAVWVGEQKLVNDPNESTNTEEEENRPTKKARAS